MPNYEYKVVPAPKKGLKGKGIKGADARFANAMMSLMNEFGADGWEYQRSDTLPCEERTGLRGRSTTFQNMLVFRRELSGQTPAQSTVEQAPMSTPAPQKPEPAEAIAEPAAAPVKAVAVETATKPAPTPEIQHAMKGGQNTAPKLGPALGEAREVIDPRKT